MLWVVGFYNIKNSNLGFIRINFHFYGFGDPLALANQVLLAMSLSI